MKDSLDLNILSPQCLASMSRPNVSPQRHLVFLPRKPLLTTNHLSNSLKFFNLLPQFLLPHHYLPQFHLDFLFLSIALISASIYFCLPKAWNIP